LGYYLSNASITGTLEAWNLADFAPDLVAMKTPRMSAEVNKTALKFTAKGMISGDAVVANITIPIGY
jgi:hypothetical protein